jgi:hypothetical protein
MTDIENYLTVLHVLGRNGDTISGRINDNVRRMAVIAHPLMHGTQQIWAF